MKRLKEATGTVWCRWLLVLCWAGVIYAFSSWPSPPSVGTSILDLIVKKSAHFTEFGVLALLLLRAWRGSWRHVSLADQLAAWVMAAVYASLDELHQTFTPGRTPSPRDVGIDISGAITFLLLRAGLYRNLSK